MKNRKNVTIALGTILVIAASAGVLAGLGDDDGGAVNVNVNNDRPGGNGCTCPLNYDPVVCKVPGAMVKQIFSNACFAGCAGATECRSVAVPD